MYQYIGKVTLRIALIAPLITYAVTAWGLHQKYLDAYVDWSNSQRVSQRVFECLSKVPVDRLRAAENAYGNLDARKFNCIFRDKPYWTNIKEVSGDRIIVKPPKYWTLYGYRLELIPAVSVAVILVGALFAAVVWLVRWIFGVPSRSNLAPPSENVSAWIMAIVTGTISAVVAGIVLTAIM